MHWIHFVHIAAFGLIAIIVLFIGRTSCKLGGKVRAMTSRQPRLAIVANNQVLTVPNVLFEWNPQSDFRDMHRQKRTTHRKSPHKITFHETGSSNEMLVV